MAEVKRTKFDISLVPYLLKVHHNYWVDYDEDTDTLYVSFRKPQCADDSVMEGGLIYHYDGEQLVGVTILDAKATMTSE